MNELESKTEWTEEEKNEWRMLHLCETEIVYGRVQDEIEDF